MWELLTVTTEDNLRADNQRLRFRISQQAIELCQAAAVCDELKIELERLRNLIIEHDRKGGHNRCWENCRELSKKALGADASLCYDRESTPFAEILLCCLDYQAKQRDLTLDDETLVKKLLEVVKSYL